MIHPLDRLHQLTAGRVQEVFRDCEYDSSRDTSEPIRVRGVWGDAFNAEFDLDRVQRHRSDICAMLAELPDSFRATRGDGDTFRNAHIDRHGDMWSGLRVFLEELLMLGTALGVVEFKEPREEWLNLPDGPTLTITFPWERSKA